MPLKVDVTPQLQEVLNKLEVLGQGVFPHTARAVRVSSSFVMRTWVNMAQGQDLSGKPQNLTFNGSIDYANSIRILSLSPFHQVVYSDSEIGSGLEKGRPAYDMKPALVQGPRSRVAKDGHRYNIIPFRHKVRELKKEKVGSQNAYAIAKGVTQQKIIGMKIDSEGKKRLVYAKWTAGKRMDDTSNRFLAGMVRMAVGTTGEKRSHYLTFRIVSLSQVGKWIRKEQPPWPITEQVINKTRDKVQEFIKDGISKDLGI